MNYEEKYKEALERAKLMYSDNCETVGDSIISETVEKLFPELKESEGERDEKMRESILKGLIDCRDAPDLEWTNFGGARIDDCITWIEKQKEPEDKGEISDGYHTFNELYYYRMLYNAAFFNLLPKEVVHKSKRHHDGEECFGGGWFIVMANLPTGQISNHYELEDWDLFQIPEKETADEWDGHTPQEAAKRLHEYLLQYPTKKVPTEVIKPKFNVGDWLQYRSAEPFLVEEITEQGYINGDSCLPFEWENEIHLWSIQDAKDGDVLACGDKVSDCPFIFHNLTEELDPRSYCGVNTIHQFQVNDENGKSWCYLDGVRPANKKQQDYLFQKMREAGYMWEGHAKKLICK